MPYPNGLPNSGAASRLPYNVKQGIVNPNDRYMIDDSKPNNWLEFEDNVAGTAKIHFLIGVDKLNQTYLSNPNGVKMFTLQLVQMVTPSAPTITNAGTAATTTDAYKIVARNGNGVTVGTTPASSAGTTTTAAATLTTTNYNVITWPNVAGAAFYDVYRTTAAGTPSTTGLIGTVAAFVSPNTGAQPATYSLNDTGLVGDGTTAPTTNTSGAVNIPILAGGITVPVVGTPTGIVATVNGTAGSTSNTYKLVARGQVGTSAASSGTTPSTCAATLTTVNSVTLTWDPEPDAVSYDIYRTSAGGTPSTTGLIGNVLSTAALSFTDTGIAGDSSTPPSANTTGSLNVGAINDVNGNPGIIFTATANAVNGFTETNAATGNGVALAASGSDANVSATFSSKGAGAVTVSPGGATGTVVVGSANQSGTITVGSSSAAANVAIAAGAGAPTVTIGNVSTAGTTVTIAGAVTAANVSDTINIATGNPGANGTKRVNIATGVAVTAGDSQVMVGGGANSSVTVNGVTTSYQAWNFLNAGGANNAITATLHDANGSNITVAAGLRVTLSMGAFTLTAGANTLNLNGGGNASIKSALNPANNISTAVSANAVVELVYNGAAFCVIGQ